MSRFSWVKRTRSHKGLSVSLRIHRTGLRQGNQCQFYPSRTLRTITAPTHSLAMADLEQLSAECSGYRHNHSSCKRARNHLYHTLAPIWRLAPSESLIEIQAFIWFKPYLKVRFGEVTNTEWRLKGQAHSNGTKTFKEEEERSKPGHSVPLSMRIQDPAELPTSKDHGRCGSLILT